MLHLNEKFSFCQSMERRVNVKISLDKKSHFAHQIHHFFFSSFKVFSFCHKKVVKSLDLLFACGHCIPSATNRTHTTFFAAWSKKQQKSKRLYISSLAMIVREGSPSQMLMWTDTQLQGPTMQKIQGSQRCILKIEVPVKSALQISSHMRLFP